MKLLVFLLSCSCILFAGPVQWTVGSGGNGHYYEVVSAPDGITWDAASAAAIDDGGYLATITSAPENTFIFDLANDPAYFLDVNGGDRALGAWFGGYRTGPAPSSFDWISGELFAYTDWATNEPSDTNGDENGIQFIGKCAFGSPTCPLSPTWNDLSSGLDTYYSQLPIAYVVEFDSLPEPASLTLVLAGIAVIWLRRHSR